MRLGDNWNLSTVSGYKRFGSFGIKKLNILLYLMLLVQLKSKDRELNAFKTLFKQTLSVSGNGNLNNNVLNNYLNGSNESNQSQSNDSSNNMCSTNNNNNITGSSNTSSNISNSSSILSSHNNSSNEWSTGGLTFMPKI